MVSTGTDYNFRSVIDDFFALKKFTGPHAELLRGLTCERANHLLAHPDVRYMPAFKILDLLASLVNIADAIAQAPQLRGHEARALMRESLADSTPLIHQFMLEAALERARYEPMMIADPAANAYDARTQLLQQRWAGMRAAHQDKTRLPDAWMELLDTAVDHAIAAPEFLNFRHGPLLQFFSEMLALARKLHQQQKPLSALQEGLQPSATLWKRFALKTARYQYRGELNATASPVSRAIH